MSDPFMSDPLTIGIFGPGKVGTAIARLAVAAGHRVEIAGSERQQSLQLLLDVLAPGAVQTQSAATLAARSDLTILAVPFSRSVDLPYSSFGGRIVIDAQNYWPAVDGVIAEVDGISHGTSEVIAARNPAARWVKSLNHLGYHDMDEHARPSSDPMRRAIAVASDDTEAKRMVSAFVDSLGFDPVDAGSLADGIHLQTGTAVFGRELSRAEFERMIGRPVTASEPANTADVAA
jgi:predicted dinucleotide-binding enzyme